MLHKLIIIYYNAYKLQMAENGKKYNSGLMLHRQPVCNHVIIMHYRTSLPIVTKLQVVS